MGNQIRVWTRSARVEPVEGGVGNSPEREGSEEMGLSGWEVVPGENGDYVIIGEPGHNPEIGCDVTSGVTLMEYPLGVPRTGVTELEVTVGTGFLVWGNKRDRRGRERRVNLIDPEFFDGVAGFGNVTFGYERDRLYVCVEVDGGDRRELEFFVAGMGHAKEVKLVVEPEG